MIHPLEKHAVCFLLCIAVSLLSVGCGSGEQTAEDSSKTEVKAMQPISHTRLLSGEYVAQMQGVGEVSIQPRVSGTVVEKYISGGETVTAGQPLFRLDPGKYQAEADKAYADLARIQIDLQNAQIDLARYTELAKTGDISTQTVTTQQAKVAAYQATAEASEAVLQKALEDLDDTVVYAPSSGQLSIDDVAIGTYAVAGSTKLVSMGVPDPIYAQFSLSEADYLASIALDIGEGNLPTVALTLDDGSAYPLPGKLVEADRAMEKSTGNLTIKALFPNPSGILLPGMFARITLTSLRNTEKLILVPQHAVQRILDKDHVLIVGEDNRSLTRVVTLGPKIGDYYVVTDGVKPEDVIIVDGLTNLQGGKELSVTMVTPEEMGWSLTPKTSSDGVSAKS